MSVTSLEAAAPETESFEGVSQELWGLLVAFAIVALWLEWWLYYSEVRKKELEESRRHSEATESRGRDAYTGQSEEQQETRTTGVAS
jgi:hypothetical protein